MQLNVNTYANSIIESSFTLMKFMEVLMNVYLRYSFNCWRKWLYILRKWTAKGVKRNTDFKIRQYDRTTKVKMNIYPDCEWYAKPLIIKEGDKALVKRDDSKKTKDIAYNTTPSIEFDKKG